MFRIKDKPSALTLVEMINPILAKKLKTELFPFLTELTLTDLTLLKPEFNNVQFQVSSLGFLKPMVVITKEATEELRALHGVLTEFWKYYRALPSIRSLSNQFKEMLEKVLDHYVD